MLPWIFWQVREKQMKRVLANFLVVITSSLVVLIVFEAVLRYYPTLISERVLMEFPKPLRRDIAARLGLPLKQARRCISTAERYDKGPELCLAYPDFEWVQRADDIDRKYGAREITPQDGNGFCNTKDKSQRDHNTIVFIGDSFTWCTAIRPENTFASLLETATGQTTYNLGVPGVGPYEYIELLRRFGLKYTPRIVVMGIYEGNDLRDGIRYQKTVDEWRAATASGRETGDTQDGAARASIFKRMKNSSYSLSYIGAALEALSKRFHEEKINFHYRVESSGNTVPMNVTNADIDEVKNARLLGQGKVSLDVWHMAMAEFAKLAREYRFEPIVIYIPSAYTAYASSVVFEDDAVAAAVTSQSGHQREYLAGLARDLGLEFLDLTDFLQEAVLSSPLAYYPANVHLTEQGHALIARALAPRLEALMDKPGEGDGEGRKAAE